MSLVKVAKEYKDYEKSSIMKELASKAHGDAYMGQTSSATFEEICSLINKLSLPKEAHILDAGCGNGAFAIPLAQTFGFKVTGIDISPEVIAAAEHKAKVLKVDHLCSFHIKDFSLLTEQHTFDLILSIGSLYWNQPLTQTLNCWHQALKIKGRLVLFLNLAEEKLTEEEQKDIGETSFIFIDQIKECLSI